MQAIVKKDDEELTVLMLFRLFTASNVIMMGTGAFVSIDAPRMNNSESGIN